MRLKIAKPEVAAEYSTIEASVKVRRNTGDKVLKTNLLVNGILPVEVPIRNGLLLS